MIKKLTPAVCVLIFLFLTLCACDAGNEEIQPEAKIATDSSGNKYSVVVDVNGFLSLGDRDSLAVCTTDENGNPGKNSDGEFVTRAEDFPDTLVVDNEIHTRFFRMPVPEGWTNISDEIVKLSSGAASLTINDRGITPVKECTEEIKNIMSAIGEGKEEKAELQFADAVKLTYENRISVYIFEAEGRTYFIRVTADEKLFEEINFEEIINTIKFRKGE